MIRSESVNKLFTAIEMLQESTAEVNQELDLLVKQLSKLDLEINDIQHYLEFAELESIDSPEIVIELKNLLLKRRETKQQIELLKSVNKLISSRVSQISSVTDLTEKINERDHDITERFYAPRIRKDLFKDLEHKCVKRKQK